MSFTWLDVIPDYGHMIIPVGSCVFMPEADNVAQFVNYNAKLVTVLPYGDGLGSVATTTDIGTTPKKIYRTFITGR